MSANERRTELIRILTARRRDTVLNLAHELGVCERTILRDIEALTIEYPLVTYQGNGGGVGVEEWYHPHKIIFSREQIAVLQELMANADEHQRKVVEGLLREYGSPKCHSLQR